MTVTPPSTLTVYRTVGTVTETCSHGCTHEVAYVEVKRLTDTGETRIHDNGYEQRPTPLFVDAQGRIYHRHVSIDYYANTAYVRDDDQGRFAPRVYSTDLARDLTGRPVLDGTPPGPAWSPDLPGAVLGIRHRRPDRRPRP